MPSCSTQSTCIVYTTYSNTCQKVILKHKHFTVKHVPIYRSTKYQYLPTNTNHTLYSSRKKKSHDQHKSHTLFVEKKKKEWRDRPSPIGRAGRGHVTRHPLGTSARGPALPSLSSLCFSHEQRQRPALHMVLG